MTSPLLRTPLHEAHLRHQARLVDFHGWEMPLQYAGILDEHAAVRKRAGLFDLSHMGRVVFRGPGRRALLQRLLTIDVEKVQPGRCRYTFLLAESGGVLDDLVLYADQEEDLLVVNASNREKDLAWIGKHRTGGVEIEDRTAAVALIAVQGPASVDAVKKALDFDPSGLGYYTFARFGDLLVSRTGYTGEDGFEVFAEAARAAALWERLVAAGAVPTGLGARDTLRTEAGMPLYGNDIDETTTPLEAGLGFAVEMDKPEFIGQAALRSSEPARARVGLALESRRIARQGYEVFHEGRKAGVVTSGTWSPTLEKSIGMAYVGRDLRKPGTALEVDVRGRREKSAVVKLPFYRREKS